MLQPELNIAQIAGAPFTGRSHSVETKSLMSKTKKGITPTLAIAACSIQVELIDTLTGINKNCVSISQAAKDIGCTRASIWKNEKKQNIKTGQIHLL